MSIIDRKDYGMRASSQAKGHLSGQTGTYMYMAPEMIDGKEYDEKVGAAGACHLSATWACHPPVMPPVMPPGWGLSDESRQRLRYGCWVSLGGQACRTFTDGQSGAVMRAPEASCCFYTDDGPQSRN